MSLVVLTGGWEVASLGGWRSVDSLVPGDLVMGMGHVGYPLSYASSRRMELAAPILRKDLVHFEGHAVSMRRWWGEMVVHPMSTFCTSGAGYGQYYSPLRLKDRTFASLMSISGNFSMVCANLEPPLHEDYTRLPRDVPLSEILRVKSEYLQKGLWVQYRPDSARYEIVSYPDSSWYAIGRDGFLKILSDFLGYSVQDLRSRQKIEVRDIHRMAEFFSFLQILCIYYGLHATIEFLPRTVLLKIAPRNILTLQQRQSLREILSWVYVETQVTVLVSRLRYYLVRVGGEPFFLALTRENAEKGSVR